jgi:hypothetical protein
VASVRGVKGVYKVSGALYGLKTSPRDIVASVRGVKGVYKVSGALYGLKTSPRDDHEEVVERLTPMGFVRDSICRCRCLSIHKR